MPLSYFYMAMRLAVSDVTLSDCCLMKRPPPPLSKLRPKPQRA